MKKFLMIFALAALVIGGAVAAQAGQDLAGDEPPIGGGLVELDK
ncbi:hypothetical protein [Halobacillus litoralis]|nr:hypothetical protein [Halobacillus litoralis]